MDQFRLCSGGKLAKVNNLAQIRAAGAAGQDWKLWKTGKGREMDLLPTQVDPTGAR